MYLVIFLVYFLFRLIHGKNMQYPNVCLFVCLLHLEYNISQTACYKLLTICNCFSNMSNDIMLLFYFIR